MDEMHEAGETELPCPLCISGYSPTFKLSGDYRLGTFLEASPYRCDQLLSQIPVPSRKMGGRAKGSKCLIR